jgi:hypothetical protein
MKDEWERIWKEATVVYSVHLFRKDRKITE